MKFILHHLLEKAKEREGHVPPALRAAGPPADPLQPQGCTGAAGRVWGQRGPESLGRRQLAGRVIVGVLINLSQPRFPRL